MDGGTPPQPGSTGPEPATGSYSGVIPCGTCGTGIDAVFRYCGACGSALHRECPHCRGIIPAAFQYCGWCGTAQSPPAAPVRNSPGALPFPDPPSFIASRPAVVTDTSESTEQRRRVAILFADLSGSTALSDRLEVEAAFRLVSECVTGLGRIVADEGGYVVKTLGDGLMALFGAPAAYGDDPTRAARAGLKMQAWMEQHSSTVEAEHQVRLRVGINYGSVVAAEIAAGDRPQYDVLGDAVNVAQRLEAAAEPGSVTVSEAFYRITRADFEYRDVGSALVKGKPEPLRLFQVLRELPPEARKAEETGFPLAGRDGELSRLLEAARALRSGGSDRLALTGEGGMGKSRLLEELSRELEALGVPVLSGLGSETGQVAPLTLWRDWLRQLLPLGEARSFERVASRLQELLEGTPAEAWAEWLAAVAVQPGRLFALSAEARAAILQNAFGAFLQFWSGGRPGALLIDEAGLLDPLSLALLIEAGARGGPEMPALLVVLAGRRTEAYPPAGIEAMELGPLPDGVVREWIHCALPGVPISDRARNALVERSGGSPLFLDLILRAARDSSDPEAVLGAVPDTVYGMVQSQLDMLSPEERRTAETAAILGRAFPERWLGALVGEYRGREVMGCGSAGDPTPQSPAPSSLPHHSTSLPPYPHTPLPPHSPTSLLPRTPWHALEARGLLVERAAPPERELIFRHGAMQEVLCESLLSDRRRDVHARAAVLVTAEAEGNPELAWRAARHWLGAAEWSEALRWTRTAAEHAASIYAGPEAEELYRQCRTLAQRLVSAAEEARAILGLAETAAHRGEFPTALGYFRDARQLLVPEAGTEEGRWELRASIDLGEARVLSRTGEVATALPLLQRALAEMDAPRTPTQQLLVARCLIEEALACSDLGRLQEALASGEQALRLTEEAGGPIEQAAAHSALGLIHPLRDDWARAEHHLRQAIQFAEGAKDWKGAASAWSNLGAGLQSAGRLVEAAEALEKAYELARRIADVEKMAIARMNLGTVHLNRGDWTAAATAFRASLGPFRSMGHALGEAASLYNLADALRWGSQHEPAEAVLVEAEEKVRALDAPHLQVHIGAARAELALGQGDLGGARERTEWALWLACEADYEGGVRLARLALGRVLFELGDLEGAERELRAATKSFEQAGEPLEAARARAHLATVLHARGEGETARELLERSRQALVALDAGPWLAHLPPLPAR